MVANSNISEMEHKEDYLSSVVDTALATEKVIREKGKMAVLIGVLGGLLLGLILIAINIVAARQGSVSDI